MELSHKTEGDAQPGNSEKPAIPFPTAESFFENAQHCTIIADVSEKLREEAAGRLIDPDALRRGRDWSRLSHQVVGGED